MSDVGLEKDILCKIREGSLSTLEITWFENSEEELTGKVLCYIFLAFRIPEATPIGHSQRFDIQLERFWIIVYAQGQW